MPGAERATAVLVIGAGQAGLACGHHLQRAGIDFLIVDRLPRVGDSWRRRYTALRLFTPRAFSALPGLNLGGAPDGYPTRLEFADYLEGYAAAHALPVLTGTGVARLRREGAAFEALLDGGRQVRSRHVIIATGGFQVPVRPSLGRGFDPGVVQLDPESYRNADSTPPGPVLVVGDGASGRDIAAELAPLRETALALGKPRRLLPERVLGRSVWWWLRRSGLLRLGPNNPFGGLMRRTDPFPDRGLGNTALQDAGVRLLPRLTGAAGHRALFADGQAFAVTAVVWAVGYRDDFSWLDMPEAKDGRGSVRQRQGVSPVAGLYVVGRPWQRNRASALVMGAGEDARVVVDHITTRERAAQDAGPPRATATSAATRS